MILEWQIRSRLKNSIDKIKQNEKLMELLIGWIDGW